MTIRFHSPSDDPQWQDSVRLQLSLIEICQGSPADISVLEDAWFIPGSHCLYDAAGHRVIESCVRRSPGLAEIVEAGPQSIPLPEQYDVHAGNLLYLSWLPNHWGHFLTEGISRLWATAQLHLDGSIGYFYTKVETSDSMRSCLSLAGVEPDRIVTFARPTKIRRVYVPEASFSNRGRAYACHADWPRGVAERALGAASRRSGSDQPVYISRSAVRSFRTIRNESTIEALLAARVVMIWHPERLPLSDQIQVINEHATFIGCWGSAFHNQLFNLDPSLVSTHLFCEGLINPNFYMLDAILGLEANYVRCLHYTPGVEQAWPNFDFSIDTETAIAYLEDQGIV
jgi:capsular polysaccharide biosynthesis protein